MSRKNIVCFIIFAMIISLIIVDENKVKPKFDFSMYAHTPFPSDNSCYEEPVMRVSGLRILNSKGIKLYYRNLISDLKYKQLLGNPIGVFFILFICLLIISIRRYRGYFLH